MPRTLAELARSDAPLAERLRVARELAAVVDDLAARGKAHGALSPDAVVVLEGGAVALLPPAPGASAAAGYGAPDVARGGRPSRRADAFSVGALAWLALAGRGPFDAEEPLEAVRRVLHVEAPPVRLLAPGVPLGVDAAIAALLEKRARRRGGARELVEAIDGADATATATSTPVATAPPLPGPLPRSAGERGVSLPAPVPRSAGERGVSLPGPVPRPATDRRAARAMARATRAISKLPTPSEALAPVLRALALAARALGPAAMRALRAARTLPPLPRTALAALPVFAIVLVVLPRSDAALARRVADLVASGDVAAAREVVDAAARQRPSDPVIEKLRGDVACARGAAGECLRRYRVAIAAREDLSGDPALRANARRLLSRSESCGTRRAAAQLLGELRDPEALPALEEARRSAGIFAVFCTGDSIDRAIAATRTAAAR